MTKKLNAEHIDELKLLRNKFSEISLILGNIAIEEHVLQTQIQKLTDKKNENLIEFESLYTEEQHLLEKMREYYGEGQIDIVTGIFTST